MKCKCNRIGEHCPQCGSISKHPLIQRTSAAIGILRIEIRYYRCRKCGTEYGWFQGKFYDQECLAPLEIKITPIKQEVEDLVKKLNESIYFVRSYGGVVDFPKGILEEPIDPDAIQENSQGSGSIREEIKEGSEGAIKELGFTRDAEGKLVAPFSIDDFLRKKKEAELEEPNDENNH